jgi:16S rRNA G966 N2-methylase RsmD
MKHIEYQIPPIAHTPMYNWHKFWSRKTWNVVSEFVKAYCPEGGIVIDPFSGSGVTALEALRNNRRAIAIDINPIATSILKATVEFVPENAILEAFAKIEKAVRPKIESMYDTKCRSCGAPVGATCYIWKRTLLGKEKLEDVRYTCPQCGSERRANTSPTKADISLAADARQQLTASRIWYPDQKLEYTDGQPFKERQRYHSVDQLFTNRALYSLGLLRAEIDTIADRPLRELFLMAFSSMVHLASKMMPDRPTRPMSGVWFEHSYWFAKVYMEQNVWDKFESAVVGSQGIVRAKAESNPLFRGKAIARDVKDFIKNNRDLLIVNGSSLDSIRELVVEGIVCDYCFADPPYDSSIQYGELTYMWVCWLKQDTGYLEKIATDEVIHNERQNKDFERYHVMLSSTFKEIHRVLKPKSYFTVTFHNPTFKVRNATIRAAVFAGFEFQKIHHQELARPSAKSLLQPFGSANGDFYLRFQRATTDTTGKGAKNLDEARFRTIVIETTKRLLAERWEPTPYTVVINHIDPVLAKEGFYHELYPGFDVKTVLQNSLGQDFTLVPTKIGGVSGECWWFKDTSTVTHHEIPLSERVEQSVLRALTSKYKVSYTDLWRQVNEEFPNSLMTDSASIVETIREYAEKTSEGEWVLKGAFKERLSEHSLIIAYLAELGDVLGFQVWIGKKEQGDSYRTPDGDKKLRVLVSFEETHKLPYPPKALKDILNIDVLWLKGDRIEAVFEVENSTSITSALERCSHIEAAIERYIVLPDERQALFEKKMHMPMFAERFHRDTWQVIYYDYFKKHFADLKRKKVTLNTVAGNAVRASRSAKQPSKKDQMQLTL